MIDKHTSFSSSPKLAAAFSIMVTSLVWLYSAKLGDGKCGTRGICVEPSSMDISVVFDIFIPFIYFLLLVIVFVKYCCQRNGSRTNSTSNNRVDMGTSTDHLPRHLETMRQRIENVNSESLQIENLRMTTPLRNTINSTTRQLSGIDCSGNQVATTYSTKQTSRQPPSYNDLVRLNLITDPMEQQSLLPPPTYDDCIRRNNEREV